MKTITKQAKNPSVIAVAYMRRIKLGLQVKKQMEEAKFQPSTKIWAALILASGQESVENAFAVWREMKERGVAQSNECLEALMNVCAEAYQGERALLLLRTVQAEG
jgi:hypothetical protein